MSLDQQKAVNISQVAGGVSDALMSGAQYFAGTRSAAGTGSPGGGGVDPASKTNQLKKMGIDTNEKWLKNYDNWEMGKEFFRHYGEEYDPQTGMWFKKA